MSQENVEIVRGMYSAFHAGDAQTALAHFAPNVLVDPSAARVDIQAGRGREYLKAMTASWVASFDEWREEVELIRDLEGQVLVVAVQRGRGKESGIEVEARYALIYEVQSGRITSMRLYRSPEDALEAAGLPDSQK